MRQFPTSGNKMTLRTLGAQQLLPSVAIRTAPLELPELTEKVRDQYEFLCDIGRGGMGSVFLVRDKALGKQFAIKLINQDVASDPRSIKRFEQEAQAIKRLNHPNLAAVYDYGISLKGAPWILMEYVAGKDLTTIIREQECLPADDALIIFIQICEALRYAHEKNIVHRDLKPSNILVTADGSNFVKLVDFGIAKVITPFQTKSQLTRTDEVIGSPQYMSPEQCQGEDLDTRSDIYSLGCVMYELLTGNPPFNHTNSIKTILDHVNTSPKSMTLKAPNLQIPPGLDAVVLKCLAKLPEARYQSVTDLQHDLELLLGGKKPRNARKNVLAEMKSSRRLRLSGITAGVIGLIFCLFVVCWHNIFANQIQTPEHTAFALAPTSKTMTTIDEEVEKDSIPYIHPSAESIEFDGIYVSDESINKIPYMRRLRHVFFVSSDVTDRQLHLLDGIPITVLSLTRCKAISPAVGLELQKFTQLRVLDLTGTPITSDSLKPLAGLLHLEELHLGGTEITGLPSDLAAIKTLHVLDLHSCKRLGQNAVAVLEKLHLTHLDMGTDKISDADLRSIAKIGSLVSLVLSGAHVTDNQLVNIAGMHLSFLNLEGTPITDKALKSLENMNSLQRLQLIQCEHISASAVDKLREKLPLCKIEQ